MNELIEITFEDIPEQNLSLIVADELANKVTDAFLNGENQHIEPLILENFLKARRLNNGDFLFLNLINFDFDGLNIPRTSVQILKYESKCDINFIFSLNDIEQKELTKLGFRLKSFASSLALKYGIENYYGGLEPACDIETQLFFRNQLGKLSIRNPLK